MYDVADKIADLHLRLRILQSKDELGLASLEFLRQYASELDVPEDFDYVNGVNAVC